MLNIWKRSWGSFLRSRAVDRLQPHDMISLCLAVLLAGSVHAQVLPLNVLISSQRAYFGIDGSQEISDVFFPLTARQPRLIPTVLANDGNAADERSHVDFDFVV